MALAGGFAEPVIAAQASFRAVLDAMAHPGRITTIEAIDQAPAPLQPASYALALTLIDFETPVWLDPALTVPSVTEALAFHCGCPLVEAAERAVFALIGSPADMPPLAAFAPGTPAYPDRSTTLIMQLPSLDGGPEVALEGPGIEDRATIAPAGLADEFWTQWAANHRGYPLGVDIVLTAGHRLLALPRSIMARSLEGGR
jgi:alpha-D-ribose 1-methylphosphonate 5-triphosphate synthase subunit PhnH